MKKQKKSFLANYMDPSQHYTYPNSVVLKNKYGIMDIGIFEEKCSHDSTKAAIDICKERFPEKFDSDYLKYIHYSLFKKTFEWAGITRDVSFTFSDGTTASMPTMKKKDADFGFAVGAQIQYNLKQLDKALVEKNNLQGLSREEFVNEAAEMFAFLNYTHPFREGNGRVQRLFFKRLAEAAGHKLDFSLVSIERVAFSSLIAVRDNDLTFIKKMFEDISNPEKVAGLREAMNRMKDKEISNSDYFLFTTTEENSTAHTDSSQDINFTNSITDIKNAYYDNKSTLTQYHIHNTGEQIILKDIDVKESRQAYDQEKQLSSLTEQEIFKRLTQDPFVQANKEEVERLSNLVYGNSKILTEKMKLTNKNSCVWKQVSAQIANFPQAIGKISGFKLCGIKTVTRQIAEDNILLLSKAVENYADAMESIERKIIDSHNIDQQRFKQTINLSRRTQQQTLDSSNFLLKNYSITL
ncbi:BID domain-containing T4SS effector [Bartonella sp. CB189]|uniref:BID domain-containing T4SS effector n=1 Tax=Bartonella sp. CB189 TaxID=3112254 RepID=UPI002F964453